MGRPAKGPSRRELKQQTRRKLLGGAIALLRSEGVQAATTGRIAAAAGIRQSSFYGHFADRDECLEAAAELLGGFVVERVEHASGSVEGGDVRTTVEGSLTSVVDALLSEPELTRLFLRYRGDDASPLGRAARRLFDRARSALARDLRRFAAVRPPARARAFAEILVAGALGLVEGLLEGRLHDRRRAIEAMTLVTLAAFGVAVHRKE